MTKILGLFTALLLTQASNAGILLEPYLGYDMGTKKCTDFTGTDCGAKETAVAIGARAGYKSMLGVWGAVDYTGLTGGKDKPNAAGSTGSDFTGTFIGATVGFDTFVGLRLYGGYSFSQNLNITTSGTSTKIKGGNTVKLGAGYKLPLLPLSFNLEYWMTKFKTLETGGTSMDISQIYPTFEMNGIMLSVSAPFDF